MWPKNIQPTKIFKQISKLRKGWLKIYIPLYLSISGDFNISYRNPFCIVFRCGILKWPVLFVYIPYNT